MTELAGKAIEIARADLGTTEHPPGSNRGKRVDQMLRTVGVDPETGSYPWCAAAVSTWIKEAGESLPVPVAFRGSASCKRLADLNMDRWITNPEPGCVGVHLNPDGTGHAFFVTNVLGGGILATIEGNSDKKGSRTGGTVVENARPPGYATHFIAIK